MKAILNVKKTYRYKTNRLSFITAFLIALFGAWYITPNTFLDPYKILNLKQMLLIVLSLASVQFLGMILQKLLNPAKGAALSGFLGGLISSTAITVSIAKDSQKPSSIATPKLSIVFLSATIAMLIEAIILQYIAIENWPTSLLYIFLLPILTSLFLIFYIAKKNFNSNTTNEPLELDFLSLGKLSLFIVVIIALTRLLQHTLGQSGVFALTFIVSLFEIHSSVAANSQLFNSGSFSLPDFGNLMLLSVLAAYISKIVIVYSLASKAFKIQVSKYLTLTGLSALLGWVVFKLVIGGLS
jgi:uncharacterized membrane protein (DUF4010 family)